MGKRVLDVGNCVPDHRAVAAVIQSHFDAEVVQTHDLQDTVAMLRGEPFDLVLVNRKLDCDYSDGLDIIKHIKQDPELGDVPVMMLTNFPQYQRLAIEAGAIEGFGKQSLHAPETVQRLRPFLAE